jgi:hypothetical protein
MHGVKIINLPKVKDVRGSLTIAENGSDIPFDINRVYFLYDVPGGSERGGHAHKDLHQLIIASSGSFDILLDDGFSKETFHLNRPYIGLYLSPMKWRVINNFSSGSVCSVIASDIYKEEDYIRNYEYFLKLSKGS